MTIDDFFRQLDAGQVPDRFPQEVPDYRMWAGKESANGLYNMWAIVTKDWVDELAAWIGDRTCVEIMAGAGWLSKALTEAGVNVKATDDMSWSYYEEKLETDEFTTVHPVERLDAVAAAGKYRDRDILLVSWPPYQGRELDLAMHAWGENRPVVYIGEGHNGCTGTADFHDRFVEERWIEIPQWSGLHDVCCIGYWRKEIKEYA